MYRILVTNFVIATLLIPIPSMAQSIQWAYKVKNFSSEPGGWQYSAEQILGKPNAMPQGGNNPCAWQPKYAESQNEQITVLFEKPVPIRQVAVFENFNPGAVKTIELIDKRGKTYKIYKAVPGPAQEKMRVLRITFGLTAYDVYGAAITLDCAAVAGPNQLDAVGISDDAAPIEAAINVIPGVHFTSKPENLGKEVNSIYTEVNPVITPDGKRIYINRKNHPHRMPSDVDEEHDEIWYSDLGGDGKWSYAVNIGKPLNNEHHNFVSAVTPDGNRILLANLYNPDGSSGGQGVSVSRKGKDGWEFPENQEILNYQNFDPFVEYYLTNDARAIVMAIENSRSAGGRDLFVSFHLEGNKWGEPRHLGHTVNSASDEISPFMAADGVTLYFSTGGRSGYGSKDIFMSRRLDHTWENWSEPVNLGPDINTSGWDAYYSIPASGEYAYFVSAVNTFGETDIFRILLPEELRPDPVVLIRGTVTSLSSGATVEAKIIYEVLPEGTVAGSASSDPDDGSYKIVLPAGRNYAFHAEAEGYYPLSENLDLTILVKYMEVEEHLKLAPLEAGQVIRLNNLFFEFGKADLKRESFPELDRLVTFLSVNPEVRIEIGGHTDNVGTDESNLALSGGRVRSVVTYLEEQGIDKGRLTSMAYGESAPVADNDTEEGRGLNRRVEFRILVR